MAEVKMDVSAYSEGFLDGMLAASWQCHDCGNTYDYTVDHCPNTRLDEAFVQMRSVRSKA